MLSQAEIDALLDGSIEADQPKGEGGVNLAEMMSQGNAPSRDKARGAQVRPYNFWSPDRFSKDQIRAVELVHEDLAERLTTTLPPYLRVDVRPRLVHVEQGRFDDFIKDLPPHSLFHMITLDPLPGRMVLTLSPEVSWTILGRLLGGTSGGQVQAQGLTEIGQSLIRSLVEYMLGDLRAAWEKVAVIDPRLEDSLANAQWVQMVMANARVLLVTLELMVQETTGTLSLYLPFSMLKPISAVLNPHAWIAGKEEKQQDPRARQTVAEMVSRAVLPVVILLGTADLSMGELVSLQPGDVVRLDSYVHHDLPVQIGDKLLFRARPGRVGNRVSVQVTSRVDLPRGAGQEGRQ